MDIVSCKRCGKIYLPTGESQICPACVKEMDEKFINVKEYIREHEEASIQQVSEANDVSVKTLMRWVRQERLEFSPKSNIGIDCELCGDIIRTGRFCMACKNEIKSEFNGVIPTPEVIREKRKERAKMRFLKS